MEMPHALCYDRGGRKEVDYIYKIAILSTQDHCDYLKHTIGLASNECSIDYIAYRAMWELPGLYKSIRDRYDGICTTGAFASEVIRRTWDGEQMPLQSIAARSVEYYEALFRLLNHNRAMDLTRVVMDSDLWLKGTDVRNAVDWLSGVSYEKGRAKLLGSMPLERIMMMGEIILENARALHADGKIDMVICRSSSAADFLRQEGIPCTFVYPHADNARDTLSMLLGEIKMAQSGDRLPAVILLRDEAPGDLATNGVSIENLNLLRTLLEYNQNHRCNMMIQRNAGGVEVYTDQTTVEQLTEQYTQCRLHAHMYGQLGRHVTIGYGIGQDISKAYSHALQALKQAKTTGLSCLVHASGSPAGLNGNAPPLLSKAPPPLANTQAADRAGLSTGTIQRIVSVTEALGTNELTTRDLAGAMQVTTANASRILNALVKSSQAEVVSHKKAGGKGRPVKIYQINLPTYDNIQ